MPTTTRDAILAEKLTASKNRAVVVRALKHQKSREERRRKRDKRREANRAALTTRTGDEGNTAALSPSQLMRGSVIAWLSRHDPRLAPIIDECITVRGETVYLRFDDRIKQTRQGLRDLRNIADRCGYKMRLIRGGTAARFKH